MSLPVPPRLARSVWTDADFDEMGWHDTPVHAVATEPNGGGSGRLLVDLDYVVEWIAPDDDETSFNYWVVPATLVFEDAWDLEVDIDLHGSGLELVLDDITRTPGQSPGLSTWTLEGHHFTLAVTSEGGFRQSFRTPPIWSSGRRLGIDQRRGISFDETGYRV